jgi:hypothetical protein
MVSKEKKEMSVEISISDDLVGNIDKIQIYQ